MPAGDPAGYLPNVLKARKRKTGSYKGRTQMKPSVPSKLTPGKGAKPQFTPMPSRTGDGAPKIKGLKGKKYKRSGF